jgi:hypothetical protein
MVEHALYMRDPLMGAEDLGDALLEGCTTEMDHMVMVGGPAERIFYAFRQALLEKMGRHTRWTSHQLFVLTGDPPTYHWQKGEPYWGQPDLPECVMALLSQTVQAVSFADGIGQGVLRDLLTLLADLGEIGDFSKLRGADKQVQRAQPINTEVRCCLQAGWDCLRVAARML